MRKEKMEYHKPTIEMIVFNYTDVMASSGVTSTWLFSDDTDSSSKSAVITESNVWTEGEITDNDSMGGNPITDGFSFTEDAAVGTDDVTP